MQDNPRNSFLVTLSDSISKLAQKEGDYVTLIPELTVFRRNRPTSPVHCIYQMALGVVTQGEKEVMLAGKVTRYHAGETLLSTIDLPIITHVLQASDDAPFLGLSLTLDPVLISQLSASMSPSQPMKNDFPRPLTVEQLDEGLADALFKLVNLNSEPHLVAHIAPLIKQEIIIRLLSGPYGSQLRHLATAGSPSQQISKVVRWLKVNFTQSLSMNELAASAYMSPSSFRQHFKSVTGMSPLQFQKKLRLQAARQQMISNNLDAVSAALYVGYESASQFSREYSREFGESPHRDIKNLRAS
ncbi:AraC family transcriptional regulator N-terminal domain-containing protein [Kluyvera sp. STS39-E]|uniref:AraC family transcriptional regulator n=1 Tax=Enterobacteriaceae TaxID=543 RepID=UPI000E3B96AC|nr:MULTISPECIES: AraC family transcriptional regulator [Citrobacter]MBD0826591.1 AraC family transcriptional regulator [Citrobacter sp. C1]RFU93315.1 AraC family transcriptional regulator [Citrobacter gillenii]